MTFFNFIISLVKQMKRIFYFDNIKGLLILFVVLTHTLGICSDYYGFSRDWFKIITFFMMPLFIFITGIFARKSKKTPIKRASKMLIIFIIAQVLITLYYGLVLKTISPFKSIITPRFTLWYLLTCAWLYLLEYVFRKFKFKYVFIISLLFAILSGFISVITNTLSLTRTVTAIPFFVLGYYQKDIKLFDKVKKYKNVFFILTLIITVWFLFNQDFFLFKDTYLKYSYFVYDTPLECFLKRCLLYVIFFIFSGFILNIMPRKKTFLASLGNKTLTIYLIHGVLLKTIAHYKLFIDNAVIGTILTYALVIIITLTLDFIIKLIKKKGGILIRKFIRTSKKELYAAERTA